MDTIFMNSRNHETSDSHRLLLNLSDKIKKKNLKRSVNLLLYQILEFTIHEKKY